MLNLMGKVYEEIIQEFYANAIVERDHINCWLKGRKFYVTRETIQEILVVRPMTPHTSLQYDERREKLGPIVEVFGGKINKKALHTIPFTPEMRTLAYIMIFNLYPVRNLTNLSALRSIFLFEIDICSHIYHLFTKCITKWNSRLTLLAAIARVEVHAVLASLAISVKKGEIVLRGSIAGGGEQFSTP